MGVFGEPFVWFWFILLDGLYTVASISPINLEAWTERRHLPKKDPLNYEAARVFTVIRFKKGEYNGLKWQSTGQTALAPDDGVVQKRMPAVWRIPTWSCRADRLH